VRDAARELVKGLAFATPFAIVTAFYLSSDARSTRRELLDSERRNTELHAMSKIDRKLIHQTQARNVARIVALERAVKKQAATPKGPP
jgi:hypothetical protein